MITLWYGVVSFMLILYIVLDGRNFGAGMLHWLVARTQEERRQVVAAIGPLWSWHEVWLVGFGGTLMAVFPRLMATSFAGYYLALFLILWCLLLRGMALEVGGHINDRMWQGFWDFVFVISSFLLAILFGAAGGNVARGVPVDSEGNFTMAFFTDFKVHGNVGLIDWYTLSIAIFATVMMAAHGGTYLTLKTEGPVHDRSARYAKWLWASVIPLLVIVSLESWILRPDLLIHALTTPVCWIGILVTLVSTGALVSGLQQRDEMRAFLGSNFLIAGMLATGAATIFPVMLHSTLDPQYSLTAQDVAANPNSLFIAAIWWPFAFMLAAAYLFSSPANTPGKSASSATTKGTTNLVRHRCNPPDRPVAIFRDQECSIMSRGHTHRPAPDALVIHAKAGQEILVLTGGNAVVHAYPHDLITGPYGPIP